MLKQPAGDLAALVRLIHSDLEAIIHTIAQVCVGIVGDYSAAAIAALIDSHPPTPRGVGVVEAPVVQTHD